MAIDNKPLSADVAPNHENGNGAFTIPKTCRAGVVHENGPNFKLEVEDVDVPEPGKPANARHSR